MKLSKISLITVVHRAYVSRLDGDSRAGRARGVYDTSMNNYCTWRPRSGLRTDNENVRGPSQVQKYTH